MFKARLISSGKVYNVFYIDFFGNYTVYDKELGWLVIPSREFKVLID